MNPQGADIITFEEGGHGLTQIDCRTRQGEEFAMVVEDGEIVVRDPHDDGGDS